MNHSGNLSVGRPCWIRKGHIPALIVDAVGPKRWKVEKVNEKGKVEKVNKKRKVEKVNKKGKRS